VEEQISKRFLGRIKSRHFNAKTSNYGIHQKDNTNYFPPKLTHAKILSCEFREKSSELKGGWGGELLKQVFVDLTTSLYFRGLLIQTIKDEE
jgi:hypothetical protein